MTSSMLSGERRWASSRRGGMTVLGKVAVPKPINLPSQRLENHGLDPNVEIVPKGTFSWGSRPPSASNAWGSSSLSPNTDGSSSPSHLSACPSSGGSGTRPSTAGSDKALEPTTNAWGSNSRPSSASGTLTLNQTSLTSLHPCSAETRPGSSQLSRFAEDTAENSVGWSAGRTTEKLGVTQPENDEFSLRSGDFPTLGSEKDKSVPNLEVQDHSSHAHPGSSSEIGKEKNEISVGDDVPLNANANGGTVNSWGRDYQAYSEDSVRPNIEKWQGSPQSYPNPAIPPQHFDIWHGPSVNNPQGGVWFRGPPNGPPFGNPVVPGAFPLEPFPYYHPHIPPTGLANPPLVPSSGSGPRGHHKTGDVFRPHMPDACIHPGMPIRPGFYPCPVAYEGYYSRPMGYCNSNERDVSFMGMPAGPSVYNGYSNQNPPEPSNSQGRSGGYGSAGKPLASEQVESSHHTDTAGPYRVLVKQDENESTNWEDSETTNASCVGGRDQPRMPVWENENRSNYRENNKDLRRIAHGEQASLQNSENRGSSSSVKAKSPESTGSIKNFDDVASNVLEIPSRPSASKDSSLIQKIEGLNAKARDHSFAKSKEEQRSKFHAGSALVNHVENEVSTGVGFLQRTCATEVVNPTPRGVGASGGEKNFDSSSNGGAASSRQTAHGMQGRGNHRNKGRLNNRDADGWQKKFVVADSSTSSGAQLESSSVLGGDYQISVDAYDRYGSYNHARCDEESMQTMSDPADSHAEHAKMKELAKQRTKQLPEEEEEWTRKQKAKALAKLDELNRRSHAVQGSTQKEYATNSALPNNGNVVCQISDTSINKDEKSPVLSSEPPLETLKNAGKEPVLDHNQSVTLHLDANSANTTNASQVRNNIASKQKQMGYKQKQNLPLEKISNEKVVSTTSTAPEVENDAAVEVTVFSGIVANEFVSACGLGLPTNSTAVAESSVNQKRKNNRNGKNKHKVEEASSLATLPAAIPKEAILSKSSVDSDKPEASDFELDQGSHSPASLSRDSSQYLKQHKYLANEESQTRMNSQWKSQHSRRMARNMQPTRPAEKSLGSDAVMWAPVKPQNKTEILDESKSKIEVVNPVKSDQQVHNLKNERAEMKRYIIPKPVAKEMAQQGSTQGASSISRAPTVKSTERVDSGSQGPQNARHTNSAAGKAGSGMDSKNGDGKQTKQGKAHGLWRERNPTESTNVHDMQNGLNHDLNSEQNVQIPREHQQTQKSETRAVKGQISHFNDSSKPDGSNNPDNHDVDHKENPGETEKIEKLFSSSEHSQSDVCSVFKDNRGVGEHLTSHWQPKYQASNNQRGNRSSDENVGSEVVRVNKNDSTPHSGVSFPAGRAKESDTLVAQPHHDQSVSEENKAGDAPNVGNREAKRERNAPPKGRPNSSNQVIVSSSKQAPTSMDLGHGQRRSSGFHKNGNQNHSGRGHESRGDWKLLVQDNRHYNQPTNRERQGPNLHSEYHPGGPYDDSKLDNTERPKDGNHAGGRFRERGQTHSRRGGGNIHGR